MLEKYYRINEATGVSIHIKPDGNTDINACGISISQNQLTFQKKITSVQNLEVLTKQLPEKTNIALNLSGKGILQKQIEKAEEINQDNFSAILPNAEIKDFYVQNFVSGSKSFVSVVRKSEADKWINQLQQIGFVPLSLSLGPFPVQSIISQINIYGEVLIFNGHIVKRNEEAGWLSCHFEGTAKAPFPIKVESETLDERLIVPYAAVFQLVMAGKTEEIQAAAPDLAAALQKQVQEKKLKVQAFLILCVFFILLLINFLLFSWLNSSNEKLTEQVGRSAQSTDDLQKVNEQVQQQEALLKVLGYEGSINKSRLIDEVASLLPEGITWKEASLDPIDLTDSRSSKTVVFFERRIQITGYSERVIPVNEWIARIKTLKWAKNVQLESYTVNSELNTGQFTIIIDY